MTKYLALGYKKIYIDDVQLYDWDVTDLDKIDTPETKIFKCLYWLEKTAYDFPAPGTGKIGRSPGGFEPRPSLRRNRIAD